MVVFVLEVEVGTEEVGGNFVKGLYVVGEELDFA